jgi:hypothetical protein
LGVHPVKSLPLNIVSHASTVDFCPMTAVANNRDKANKNFIIHIVVIDKTF